MIRGVLAALPMLAGDSSDGFRASVPHSVSWAKGSGLGLREGVLASGSEGIEGTESELLVVLSKMDNWQILLILSCDDPGSSKLI